VHLLVLLGEVAAIDLRYHSMRVACTSVIKRLYASAYAYCVPRRSECEWQSVPVRPTPQNGSAGVRSSRSPAWAQLQLARPPEQRVQP
jgi:hypothetical protein